MADAASESINVVLLDADERFRTLLTHHITTAWPDAAIESLASLGEMDVSVKPDIFVLDHSTLQQAAHSEDREIWFRAAAAITRAPCLVIAEPSDELLAVRYIKGGASDFLPKRLIKHELIVSAINDCLESAAEAETTSAAIGESTADRVPAGNDSTGEATPAAPAVEAAPPQPDSEAAQAQSPPTAEEPEPQAAASSAAPAKRNGPVIDGYSIVSTIAKGGVASVCLAHSEKHGHDVALKVLRISKSNDANRLYERFEQEYRLVSTIDSSWVVKTYDFGRTRSQVYIAMEHFPAGDLRTRMKQPLTTEQSFAYVSQIANALHELHALQILHRDLKPANVMLREDDTIALIDFGMAKQLQSAENLTLPGTVHGTPYYLSPEQAKGQTVDERSDIYSLGVMFYEMLEGKKPYASKNPLDVCMAHISEPVPTFGADFADFQPLLDWMMSKDIDARCPSMAELLGELDECGPVSA